MNLGDGLTIKKRAKQLEMNKWYHIMLTRKGRLANITINKKDVTMLMSTNNFTILNVGKKLYFGGMEKSSSRYTAFIT